MKCPNCTFDIQEKSRVCPYCNFDIPEKPVEDVGPSTSPEFGEAPGVTPAPGDAVAGGFSDTPTPEAAPSPSPSATADPTLVNAPRDRAREQKIKDVVSYVAIAAVAFACFKLGLLDNILIPMGLKAPPKAPLVLKPAPEPEPEEAEEEVLVAVKPEETIPEETQAEELEEVEEVAVRIRAPGEPADDPAMAPQEWWFYGRVYDILSLRPARGVSLIFLGGANEKTFKTDAKGKYQAKLSIPSEVLGYEVLLDTRKYDEEYLVDHKRSFPRLNVQARSQLRATTQSIPPWRGKAGKWVRRDLALFPVGK